jgi:hypothetical protein
MLVLLISRLGLMAGATSSVNVDTVWGTLIGFTGLEVSRIKFSGLLVDLGVSNP